MIPKSADGGIGVKVDVAVGVAVAVGVEVAVAVPVEVAVGVDVAVAVDVAVRVAVAVEVAVRVAVDVEVALAIPVEVRVGVGPLGGGVFVFVFTGIAVLVLNTMDVGLAVCVGMGVRVFGGTMVGVPVGGAGVRVSKNAPGVRKLTHTGLVRMAESRGSKKLTGRPVRKSLLGLRFDRMLVSSFQLGAKRSAHPLVMMMQMNPNSRIKIMIMTELRLSFSRGLVFIETSIDREAHVDCGARVGLFVMTCARQPDASAVRVYDTARNGESQPGTAALEFCFA